MTSPTSLVTGGAGFLGAHLATALVGRGHSVVVLDDLSGGCHGNVPPQATFVEGSVTDHELVNQMFVGHRFDYVYHLAAYAAEGLSHHIKRFNYINNLVGSVNLINAAVRHRIKCFVFTSSVAVYGTRPLPLTEDTPPQPEDPYGIAKLAVERELEVTHRYFGLDYVVFRPHNVYGELQNIGDRYRNVVGIFMNQLLSGRSLTIFGDGRQTRAFSYIQDIIPTVARAVEVEAAYGEVFNIGADQPYSVLQLAQAVCQVFGIDGEIRHLPERGEVRDAWASHDKVQRVFGPMPMTRLEDGLARMAEWVRKVGVRSTRPFTDIELDERLPPVWREDPRQAGP
jgi:UDP-glucose 4-epimerase